jgi:3-isopropylmalate/(R)-2-methylmalate dehydratase large subunit
MGMTIIEKILARKAGRDSLSVGDVVVVDVDMTVLIDLQFATMWIPPLLIHDPDKLAIVMDHAVPAPTIKDAAGGSHARKFAADFGIKRFFDVGRHGICHQVIAENGLARPGEVLACTDSHTCAGGAYNAAARGLGPAEVYSIMCTGATWYQIAPTIRYEFGGVKPDVVSGKDIFLHIANEYGDAANLTLEFGGSGLAGYRCTTVARSPPRAQRCPRTSAPSSPTWCSRSSSTGSACRTTLSPSLMPMPPIAMCAGSISVHCSRTSRDRARSAAMACRCPNSTSRGSTRHSSARAPTVSWRIWRSRRTYCAATPSHRVYDCSLRPPQAVYRDAMRRGYLQDIADAGGVVTNSTCGACFGYHMGVVGPGEVCITSSTRNFTGRMGSAEAEIFMASPATVAASAITGYITDPRSVTA